MGAVAEKSVASATSIDAVEAAPAKSQAAPAKSQTDAKPTPSGNLSLSFSEAARAEDKLAQDNSRKRTQLEQGKKVMLEKLTKQLQLCLARVQSGDLDDAGKEKYQDMIASLKGQMLKISGVQ